METRANPLIVGLFALAVIVGAFAFVMWMGSYGARGDRVTYNVVFQGEVTGLTEGSSVLYNGIRVGEVIDLGLAPEHPSRIVATIRIEQGFPVTQQTKAQLQFQGITGVAYVQLQPEPNQGDVETLPPGATIIAQRSNFQDLLEGGQSLLTKIDSIAGKIEQVLEQNDQSVTRTIQNVEEFTTALAGNSDNVQSFLADASSAARRLNELGEKVGTLSETLNTLIGAVNPDDVRQTVSDVRTFADALAQNTDRINQIADNVTQATERFNALAGNLEGAGQQASAIMTAIDPEAVSGTLNNLNTFTGQLAAAGDQLDTVVTDVGAAARRIDEVGGSVNTLVAAIDPGRVSNTISNAESFTASLARTGGELDGLMTDARSAVQEFGGASSRIGTLSEDVSGIVAAIDPAEVQSTLSNVRQFSDALAANSEKVTQLVDSAVSAADRIDRASAQIETMGQQASAVVAAVDPDRISRTLGNIETFSGTLARNSETVDAFLTNARSAAESITEAGNKVAEVSETARQVVASVDSEQIRAVMGNVRNFTDMLSTNRETVARLLSNADIAAQEVGQFAGRASELATALDPTAIQRSITNVESFTVGLASKTDEVEKFIDDASAVAGQLRTTSEKLDTLISRANGMLEGGEGEGFFAEATAAARSIRTTADNLNSQLDGITGDIRRYGTGGLRQFEQLMTEGQSTLAEIERVIRRLEQNPAGFLSGGGSEVQEYNPGRRF